MKKKLLLFLTFIVSLIADSQVNNTGKTDAMQLVNSNSDAIGLSAEDMSNLRVSDAYYSKTSGLMLVYLQQTFRGLPVYNQIQVLAFKNDTLFSKAGERIPGIEKSVKVNSSIPVVSPETAVFAAIADRKLSTSEAIVRISNKGNRHKIEFNDLGISQENITAELMWSPDQTGKSVRLAWQVYIIPKTTSDYWLVRVDATNNTILGLDNLTVYDHWGKLNNESHHSDIDKTKTNLIYPDATKKLPSDAESNNSFIVNGATYRVVPFPAESPSHPGGTPTMVTNPWLAAPGNATTLKWHSNGTFDYDFTRGNNVWAKEDRDGNNSTIGNSATSTTTPDPLTFDFTPDFLAAPDQLTPAPNQQFNITNLFYWINVFHDVTYLYGFDEPAGNFQANNQGRGGVGNDWVNGDAQDGSSLNNANFSTPPDGGSGRMQMFLWSAEPSFVVNSPASIAGSYISVESNLSTNNLLQNVGPITGEVLYYNDDPAGNTHYACAAPSNSLTGKIALIVRGFGGSTCTATIPFTVKIKNAQDAGAIAVIMVNNVPGAPITMGGTDNTITIPAVMISQSDGAIIAAQLANNVNVTLSSGIQLDGDVDNGIIVHEYGHGISNRLTGGPSTTSCLGNAEHMGEGWSDYYALMLTQDWTSANINSGFNSPRGIGTYIAGETPNGFGIRSQKYGTNFTINNKVYAATIPSQVHSRGEIWCATLWDMTWNIIQQTNLISPSIYDASSSGGNCIALKLVTEAMKLQPCSPGFISGRDAILQADAAIYGGLYECAIREAFRRRGMGPGASQGSSASVTDQIPDFSFPAVNISAHPQNVALCEGNNHIFTASATVNTGATPTYQWQLSTDGGINYNNIAGATSSGYTLTGIAVSMNNNQYRCIVNGKCAPAITSAAAILTVGSSFSISQQPADATICESGNTTLTVSGSISGLTYQWQVSTDSGASYSDITNGGVYSGVTTATLNLSGVSVSFNNYRYRAVISSFACAVPVNSGVAILTVNATPAVTVQPQNAALCNGSNATFNISASGVGISYQWHVNSGSGFTNVSDGSVYAGAATASLAVAGATTLMTGFQYRCIVSGTCAPTVNSNAAVLTVSVPVSVSAGPSDITICETGNFSFNANGNSAFSILYQWQESANNGTSYSNVTNNAFYSGATTSTLSLSNIAQGMNDYRYRVIMSNAVCATPATSNAAMLTVNARPTVSLAASPYNKLLPGLSTTLTASILPSSTGFNISWYKNGTIIPGETGTTYIADVTRIGNYRTDIVNAITGCNNSSSVLAIADSASSRLYIFPTPNNGQFTAAYYNSGGSNASRTITVYDSKGARVYHSGFTISGYYSLLDINLGPAQRGIYYVVVRDGNGKKLVADKVLVY